MDRFAEKAALSHAYKNMKFSRCWVVRVAILAMLALVQGCSSYSTGGRSGVGHSPVEYVNHTLQVSFNMPLNLVLDAASGALAALQIPVEVDKKNRRSVEFVGRNAMDQTVIVQLLGKNQFTTAVQITVGTTDSAENRAKEQQIYDKMRNSF